MHAVPADLVAGAERAAGAPRRRRAPTAVAPTLVHGDYRLGNMICARRPSRRPLIDWEIWSVGDPRVELGWFLVFADGSNFPGVGRAVPGLPDRGRARRPRTPRTARRCRDLDWFDALGR